MTGRPEKTLHTASVAGTRAMVADAAWLGGRWLLGGAIAGLLAVAAMKIAGRSMPWGWMLGALFGAGAATAIALALWRRWTLERAAAELDRASGLKDTLASAVALAETEAPFEQWTVMEAERLAPTVDIRRAIPVSLDWTWWAWPTVGFVAAAAGFLVPPINWTSTPPLRAVRPADQQAAAAQIAQAAQAAASASTPAQDPASATPEQLRAVDEVLQELSRGRIEPQEAIARASGKIDELAARIEGDAHRDQERTDTIREQLARAAAKAPAPPPAEGGEPPDDGPRFSRVTESLNRGDLAGAAEAARDAARQLDQASPEERQRIADELDALADALDPPESPPGPEPSAPQPVQAPTSPQQGPQPPTSAPAASPPPATAPDPAQQPIDAAKPKASPAEGPEPRPERTNPRSEPETDEGARDRDRIRDALRDAAREVREGQPRQESPSKEPAEGEEKNQAPGQNQPRPNPSRPDRPQPSPGQQPGQPEAQRDPGAPQQPSQQRQGDEPGTTPRNEDPQQQPEPTRRTDGAPATKSDDGSKAPSGAPTGATGPAGQQAPTGQPTPQNRPSEQPGRKIESQDHSAGSPQPQGPSGPTGAPPAGSDPPASSDPKGIERVAKEFERIAREQQKVDSQQKQAREMRELARRMLENSTPEQREQFRQMAERMSKREAAGGSEAGEGPNNAPQEGRTPTATAPSVPVDVRRGPGEAEGPRPVERTIAEWYSSKPEARGETASGPIPQDALRSAAEGLQRSIEQQQVPARYEELVRRVFKRYAGQQPR